MKLTSYFSIFLLVIGFGLCSYGISYSTEKKLIADGMKAPEFSLMDQDDQKFKLDQFDGKILLIIASDRDGAKYNALWLNPVREKYGGEMSILGMANLKGLPSAIKGIVKGIFRARYKTSVLLDWEGEVFDAYGMLPKVSNIILVDRSGKIYYTETGKEVERKKLNKLIEAIERALGEP